ncbi:MAG: ABC transporter ATP-binding protein [Calditrichia bacterium]
MGKKQKEKNLRLYLRIMSYLRPYAALLGLILLLNFMYIAFNALSIWMVAPFISTLFESNKPAIEQPITPGQQVQPAPPQPKKDVSIFNLNAWLKEKTRELIPATEDRLQTLKFLCLIIFVTFFLKNAFSFSEAYWVSFVEQRVIKDLRDQVYSRLLWQPFSFFQKFQTGNLISRITNDINSLNVAVNRSFTKIIRDPVVIIIFLALLFSISWRLTLLALIIIPISGVLIQRIGQSLKRKSRRVQERIADVTTVLQETISGVNVVKAFAMENFESEKFRSKTHDHFRAVLRQVRLNRLSSPLSETLGVGIMVSVLWFGGKLVLSGQLLTSEDFIRFIIILFSVMEPIKSLGELNNNIQMALASGKRVFEILDEPVTITDKPNAMEKKRFDDRIVYENVSFRYDNNVEMVLKNVSFQLDKNRKIAFVGRSGAGKSTLVNLLPRFYDITGGSIKIDGTDIRDLKLADLRGLMGIVTQEVILFNDTVANNIAYGMPDYSMAEIERAARMAYAYDFITQMPEGFQTIIGERGTRLSGGQRQRISIARAILKNPPILIFDEATSSLDSEAEHLIQQAMEMLMKDRTVLIIAHRLSSVISSDVIILLEEGEINDMGKHEELLERSERYRHLYELQFAI